MSPGQMLYERKNPKYVRMIPADCHFPTAHDVVLVKSDHTAWEFLTARAKEGWETYAVGHNLLSGDKS